MRVSSYAAVGALCLTGLLTGCASTDGFAQSVNSIVADVQQGLKSGLTSPEPKSEVTDWTFYLAPMQEGCNYPHMSKDNPQVLRKSVENVYRKGNPELEGDEVTYYFNLKNAVAFGYPITRVEYL